MMAPAFSVRPAAPTCSDGGGTAHWKCCALLRHAVFACAVADVQPTCSGLTYWFCTNFSLVQHYSTSFLKKVKGTYIHIHSHTYRKIGEGVVLLFCCGPQSEPLS